MLGKKIVSKVPSFSLREDNLDIRFPTWWHATEKQITLLAWEGSDEENRVAENTCKNRGNKIPTCMFVYFYITGAHQKHERND